MNNADQTHPFTWPVRVYWEDTDGGGIVYYANYLKFMERARTELLRQLGVDQSQLAAERGLMFAVIRTQVEYLQPARLDDQLLVTCRPVERSRVSFTFDQEIRRDGADGELLARGQTRAACVDCRTMKPRRLPPVLEATLLKGVTFKGVV
jgi:acyl-CoA thioester hydrolase